MFVTMVVLVLSTVDINGLIHTESGGNALASGDNGKSLGICQIQKSAWKDVTDGNSALRKYEYSKFCYNPNVNRIIAYEYVNHVLPKRYFKAFGIPDSDHMRLAAYKCGIGVILDIWRTHKSQWKQFVPETVKRDLNKYDLFVKEN